MYLPYIESPKKVCKNENLKNESQQARITLFYRMVLISLESDIISRSDKWRNTP